MRFHDLDFAADLMSARRGAEPPVRFTRLERRLLLRFTASPNRLLTREQLLAALDGSGDPFDERKVDYVINRLRRKLGDDKRSPRFIATQYGEGYCWIAELEAPATPDAFILIGPIFGKLGNTSLLERFLTRLHVSISAVLQKEKTVRILPRWRAGSQNPAAIEYSLEIGSYDEDGKLHLALVLRDGPSQSILSSYRRTVPEEEVRAAAETFARHLIDDIWRQQALSAGAAAAAPGDNPAHINLHDAAFSLSGNPLTWPENAERLRRMHEADRENPKIALMLGLNGYARLVQSLGTPLFAGQWKSIEDEIEKLALYALSKLESDDQALLSIAKLLRFIDRGHLKLAEKLTEAVFEKSTSFGAIFSMKGEIAASHGDIALALSLYDQALEMIERGSQFHFYLLVQRLVALMANDSRYEIDQVGAELFEYLPPARSTFGLFLASPRRARIEPDMEAALSDMPPETARHFVDYLYRIGARSFERRKHKRNVMKGFVTHVGRIHGDRAIPSYISRDFPELLASAR